jgi:cystathionine beta-lyase/cystathionine gamma-synthase
MSGRNPIEDLADLRHEFGEHGGVNMSVEASSTFTVIDPETMPALFQGRAGPDKGCYLYGRHFNPTVYNLGRQMAALWRHSRAPRQLTVLQAGWAPYLRLSCACATLARK